MRLVDRFRANRMRESDAAPRIAETLFRNAKVGNSVFLIRRNSAGAYQAIAQFMIVVIEEKIVMAPVVVSKTAKNAKVLEIRRKILAQALRDGIGKEAWVVSTPDCSKWGDQQAIREYELKARASGLR